MRTTNQRQRLTLRRRRVDKWERRVFALFECSGPSFSQGTCFPPNLFVEVHRGVQKVAFDLICDAFEQGATSGRGSIINSVYTGYKSTKPDKIFSACPNSVVYLKKYRKCSVRLHEKTVSEHIFQIFYYINLISDKIERIDNKNKILTSL